MRAKTKKTLKIVGFTFLGLIVAIVVLIVTMIVIEARREQELEKKLSEMSYENLVGRWRLTRLTENEKNYYPVLSYMEFYSDGRLISRFDSNNNGRFENNEIINFDYLIDENQKFLGLNCDLCLAPVGSTKYLIVSQVDENGNSYEWKYIFVGDLADLE